GEVGGVDAGWRVFERSVPRLVGSKACNTAGPQPLACAVQYLLLSMVQTVPFVAPLDASEGLAPGKELVVAVIDDGEVLNMSVVVLSWNAFPNVLVPK